MWFHPNVYDVIVIGAGHAGCEAAHIASRMGVRVLLVSSNLDSIAKMSCNPSIGGVGKGHIVREIDALGGLMGIVADRSGIQFRMLNATKGPSVRSPRAQSDKIVYQTVMKSLLEQTQGLDLVQGSVEDLLIKDDCVYGVSLKEGISYKGRTVVLSSGTFMRGLIHIGEMSHPGGRLGDPAFSGLSHKLAELGFSLGRLKTGTPPRVLANSLNLSCMEEQPGEPGICFSHYDQPFTPPLPQVSCYLTHTTEETATIVKDNLKKSALYGGHITGIGPRYCPSIEDKIVKFPDKDRHHIFLEPEGIQTQEMYVNGISTSLPWEVQFSLVQSIKGMENAVITRPAYAIEYDYITGHHIKSSMETKIIENLFLCGQINGTTGYEEAAGQGLLAGINAALKIQGKPAFSPKRYESYIGVMIDDLTNQVLDEPYRMFTSRAEYRLMLRQDNACERLSRHAFELGLISEARYASIKEQRDLVEREIERFKTIFKKEGPHTYSLFKILSRPESNYAALLERFPGDVSNFPEDICDRIETEVKYSGYIERQKITVSNLIKAESILIPSDFPYDNIQGLSLEAREKFRKFLPETVGSASRISGIASADIQVLIVALKKHACS